VIARARDCTIVDRRNARNIDVFHTTHSVRAALTHSCGTSVAPLPTVEWSLKEGT